MRIIDDDLFLAFFSPATTDINDALKKLSLETTLRNKMTVIHFMLSNKYEVYDIKLLKKRLANSKKSIVTIISLIKRTPAHTHNS